MYIYICITLYQLYHDIYTYKIDKYGPRRIIGIPQVGEPVRRLISAQPDTDDAVRARQSLLRLLMQLCQHLSKVAMGHGTYDAI